MANERQRELSRKRNKRYREKNREAINQRRKDWSAANKERSTEHSRRWHLWNTYGLTMEQYSQMWSNQGGLCAICGSAESDVVKGTPSHLAVDHCHETGRVRGLLCGNCNRRLKFIENGWYKMAVKYLENDAFHKFEVNNG